LRSRIEPEERPNSAPTPVFQQTGGLSGIIGGTGDGVDRYRIASTKTLEYWSVINNTAASSVAFLVYFKIQARMIHTKLHIEIKHRMSERVYNPVFKTLSRIIFCVCLDGVYFVGVHLLFICNLMH